MAVDCYVTNIGTKFKLQQPSLEVCGVEVEGLEVAGGGRDGLFAVT